MREILAHAKHVRSSGDIFGSREFFAGDNLARATGAFLEILGNAAEEYLGGGYQADARGRPFDGTRCYTITWPAAGLPPVNAFCSITVYDADQHLYANEIDRYVISSRHITQLHSDPGGGVTIDVQHDAPAPERVANWLLVIFSRRRVPNTVALVLIRDRAQRRRSRDRRPGSDRRRPLLRRPLAGVDIREGDSGSRCRGSREPVGAGSADSKNLL